MDDGEDDDDISLPSFAQLTRGEEGRLTRNK